MSLVSLKAYLGKNEEFKIVCNFEANCVFLAEIHHYIESACYPSMDQTSSNLIFNRSVVRFDPDNLKELISFISTKSLLKIWLLANFEGIITCLTWWRPPSYCIDVRPTHCSHTLKFYAGQIFYHFRFRWYEKLAFARFG